MMSSSYPCSGVRKKAAPSLDVHAHWLVGVGQDRRPVYGEGADKQISIRIRRDGVETILQQHIVDIHPPIRGIDA